MALRKGKSDDKAAANGRPPRDDLEAIEREHVEQLARAHAALAAAQDRSYWLDRWGIDLNAQMRKPGARRLRALLRWLRELQRGKIAVQRYAQARLGDMRAASVEDDIAANGWRRPREVRAKTASDDSPTAHS